MDAKTNRLHSFKSVDDSGYTFDNPRDDIRGYAVKDSAGERIGTVDRLLIDEDARKVRFFQVGHGGFLGLGREHSLLPVDAIERVDYEASEVYVNESRERISGSPAYRPEMVEKGDEYYASLYDYYGYPAFWNAGYIYPDYGALNHPRRVAPEYEPSRND